MAIDNILRISFRYPFIGREIISTLRTIEESMDEQGLIYSENEILPGLYDYVGITDGAGNGVAVLPVPDNSTTQMQETAFYDTIWLKNLRHPNYLPFLEHVSQEKLDKLKQTMYNELSILLSSPSTIEMSGHAEKQISRPEIFSYLGNFKIDETSFYFSVTYNQDLLKQDENLETELKIVNELGIEINIENPVIYDKIEDYIQTIANASNSKSCVHSTRKRTKELHMFAQSHKIY